MHRTAVLIVTLCATSVTSGCAKSPTPGGPAEAATSSTPSVTLPWTAPTRAELAEQTGLAIDASASQFRSTSISPSELDVTFLIPAEEVAAFDAHSGLGLREGKRVIVHASPLWELTPSGVISGSSTTHGGFHRAVEVEAPVDGAPLATVRLVITPG